MYRRAQVGTLSQRTGDAPERLDAAMLNFADLAEYRSAFSDLARAACLRASERLGFAQALSACFSRLQGSRRPSANHFALVLGDGGQNVDGQFGGGLSTATNSTPESIRVATNARLRDNRSSLAITRTYLKIA
jgi:hypothetical protein